MRDTSGLVVDPMSIGLTLGGWAVPSTVPIAGLTDPQHNGPYNRLSQKGRRRRAKQKLSNSGRRVR